MGVIYIYTLTDPLTNEIRYVGKTICEPEKRYTQHISSAKKRKTYVNIWIDDLLRDNLKPILNVVDHCVDCDWIKLERRWVRKIYEENKRLCNLTYIKEIEERDPNLSINITTDNKIKKTCEEIKWLLEQTDLTYYNITNLYSKTEYNRCKKTTGRFDDLNRLGKEVENGLSNDLEILVWYNIINNDIPENMGLDITDYDKYLYGKMVGELIKRRGGIFYNDLYFGDITTEGVISIIKTIVDMLIMEHGWVSVSNPYKEVRDDDWMMLIN